MAENPNVIITDVGTAPEAVAEVRNEMTASAVAGGSGGGAPIDRIPLNPQLQELLKAGVYTKRIASTDRCLRLVDIPTRGGQVEKYHCSRPCVGVGDQRLCPDHNKDFFQPNQTAHGTKPRSFNSADVHLSKSEMEVRNDKGELIGQLREGRSVAPASPVPAVSFQQLDPQTHAASIGQISISLNLEELEATGNEVLKTILSRISAALDELPAANIKQMKRIVKIQERLTGEESQ